ncbi:TPA: hypothetical protein HA270_03745, partial [Candidatus Woesearchaeota archaeon]|nr:hypothetical protein [Candidatus Woesearchaeota archaeon]
MTRRLLLFLALFAVLGVQLALAEANCYQYDGNESGCTSGNASIICQWFGSPQNMCNPKGCWGFSTNGTCTNASNAGLPCTWEPSDWNQNEYYCKELGCFDYDGNEAGCNNAANTIGINCTYSGGFCDPAGGDEGCVQFDGQKSNCLGTNFCIWDEFNQLCDSPVGEFTGGFGGGGGGFSPGCGMIFDAGMCNNMSGKCTWGNGHCTGVTQGLACSDVNSSSLCNGIPIFPSCCSWKSATNSCNATFTSTSCWDNMQEPPTGAAFCEDYNAVGNETLCSQIAAAPWYMPCKWNNKSTTLTTDDRCEFNGAAFFGNGGEGHFEDIGSKQSCESAGGFWKSESYVLPSGETRQDQWCEMGFGISYESCDTACWACEYQANGSLWSDVTAAQTACYASQLGFCKWKNVTGAQNGQGFCEKPFELQQAGCGMETTCASYGYYANPQQACNDDEDCRWITDSLNSAIGWCGSANTKSCLQDCGQCPSEQSCLQNGTSCSWDASQQFCKKSGGQGASSNEICFDGIDNNNNNMIDCADSSCFSDSFCGGGTGVDCFKYTEFGNSTCVTNSSGNCAWVNDTITNSAWCDMKGANCWIYDVDEASCNAASGCKWKNEFFGGYSSCDVNDTFFNDCWSLNATTCPVNGNCSWINNTFGQGGDGYQGFCDAKPFTCFERYYGNATGCNADAFCNWTTDQFSPQGGWCGGLCNSLNATQCDAESMCEQRAGFCEPENFMGGGCFQHDGNFTGCTTKGKCQWVPDQFANNAVAGEVQSGWCNDGFITEQFAGMEAGEPVMLAFDEGGCSESGLPAQSDI